MVVLITYDITEPKRRNKLNRFLKNYGINTQKSVFECRLDRFELKDIKNYCIDMLDLDEDSVRIYKICSNCYSKTNISGTGIKLTELDYVVI